MAALTWFYPPNRLQYILQLVGTPGQTTDELRDSLLRGASCYGLGAS